ncbi:SH3-like domain-containing protein [Streptomyces rimosus]|uniref:SH3-like domain-containing protein n=1 Tax=Streptomyces rimosus TaxID=1927 RepID=UPI0004CA4A15|nr:SH3-like domain-containing protein [Streptomyces rimosus]
MARLNDIGGTFGYGSIPMDGEDPENPPHPWRHDWEARVFAVLIGLAMAGVWTASELRDAEERAEPTAYLAAGYYERVLMGMELLLDEKGIPSRG